MKTRSPNARGYDVSYNPGQNPVSKHKRPKMHLNIKKGALHKEMGVKQGEKIPVGRLESLKAHGTPLEKKRANFALVARSWHHGGRKKKT